MNKDLKEGIYFENKIQFRIRYCETAQTGTYSNERVLEWFECGRTEVLRALGIPYSELESNGVFLPIMESHVLYKNRAEYDDQLELTTRIYFQGRARFRAEETLVNAKTKQLIVKGYTIHAFVDVMGHAIRPPEWLVNAFLKVAKQNEIAASQE